MSVLILPQRFKQQPQYAPQIDYSDMGDRVRFALIGNQPQEVVNRTARTGSVGTTEATSAGVAYVPSTSNTTWTKSIPDLDPYVSGSFTVNWYGVLRADTFQNLIRYYGLYGWTFYSSNWGANQIRFGILPYWRGSGGTVTGVVNVLDRSLHSVSVVYDDASATVEFFFDGESIGSGGFNKDPGAAGSASMHIAGHASLPHKMLTVQAYSGKLSTPEVTRLAQEPWRIFKAQRRRLWAVTSGGPADITGAGQIAGAEGFGFTALGAGIAATGIASAALLGNASVTAGITATGIDSAEATGSPAVAAGITAPSIAAAEAFGSGALSPEIAILAIASAEAFGTPAVSSVAPAEITGTGQIATAEALGTPALGISVAAAGVVGAEAFGNAALSVAVAAAAITSTEAVGNPEVGGVAPAEITGTGQIATAEAVGSPVVGISLAAAGLETTEAFGSAALSVEINSGSIATAEAVGSPAVVEAGPAEPAEISSAGGIASAEAFGAASVHPFVPYTGTGFQVGSGNRRPRPSRRELPQAAAPHRLGVAGIESQARLGYPALKWQGRSRKVRDEEFLFGRTA